ncbi:aroma-sacti cluster domain-containing protein [Streptomyces sp. NPDC096354]|uniref:aroma-sacti cluster domain-containing protein n=1 Tax=Streptomyces sp. NPDC096354 TaxID=3366088 RepID=UPI00382C1CC7
MSFDPLQALKAAGHPVDLLTDAQRDVLASLSEEEVVVLNKVMRKLNAVASDVEAQEVKLL